MGERGELNVGQLVRERFGGEAVSAGFTTHAGSVTDAVIHFDETRAVEPLERFAPAPPEELAETYPSGV